VRTFTETFRIAVPRDTRQRMLDLLLARLGRNVTAQRLEVDDWTLNSWLIGAKRMPDDKLALLADLIDQTNR